MGDVLSLTARVYSCSPSAFGVSPAGQLSLSDTASEHSCKCVVDDRWSVAELRRQLFDSLGPLDPQVVTIGLPFFKINPIRAIGEAGLFHVYEGIGDGADDSMPVSGLKPPMLHGMTLLIWSGSTLDGVDVSIGMHIFSIFPAFRWCS